MHFTDLGRGCLGLSGDAGFEAGHDAPRATIHLAYDKLGPRDLALGRAV